MKKRIRQVLAFLLVLALGLGICPAAPDTAYAADTVNVKISGTEYYDNAFQVLTLVNKEREKRGLTALTMDKELLGVAMQRAAETNVYFSHTRPDGSDYSTAFPEGLWGYGENIAAGQTSPKSVMSDWMDSSGHKANILSEDYNAIGIGCYKAGNFYYWVQSFGYKSSVEQAEKSDYEDGKKTVTVQAKSSLLSLKLAITKKKVKKGGTATVKVKLTNQVSHDTITLPKSQFTFTSSDKKVATVNSKGTVKGVGKGTAKIKAKFKKGGKAAGKQVTVTVT